jgi:hypothetical protein
MFRAPINVRVVRVRVRFKVRVRVCIYVYGDIQLTFQYTIISIT